MREDPDVLDVLRTLRLWRRREGEETKDKDAAARTAKAREDPDVLAKEAEARGIWRAC